jgi:hypothetical protein
VFIDASYGIHNDYKSHSGVIIMLCGGVVLSKSVKQKIVVKSSCEAEFVAVSDHAGNYLHIQCFISGLVGPIKSKVEMVLLQDNKSCIQLLVKGKLSSTERTRHIAIRRFWIKEQIDKKLIKVEYCPTALMYANICTKAEQGSAFAEQRDDLVVEIV